VHHGFSQDLAVESCRVLSHVTLMTTMAELSDPRESNYPEVFGKTIHWLVPGIENLRLRVGFDPFPNGKRFWDVGSHHNPGAPSPNSGGPPDQ
jgi:hypothetical protein